MFEILLILTAAVLVFAACRAYALTRDPLHPLIYLGPLLFYAYVYKPGFLQYAGLLDDFFQSPELTYIQTINLIGIALFCAGCLYNVIRSQERPPENAWPAPTIEVQRRLVAIAWVLGLIALLAFLYMLLDAGGLFVVYGRAKGSVSAASGYIGEAPLLAFPAIGLLFLAWHREKLTPARLALVLLFASPHLIHGLLGARRGPTFLIVAALLLSRYLMSARCPKLVSVLIAVFLLGNLTLLLLANRSRIHLGEGADSDVSMTRSIAPEAIGPGEDWCFGSGVIVTSNETQTHFWGKRLFTIFLVRPIPKQLWPTKYEDMGLGWMLHQEDVSGMTDIQWVQTVGWSPPRGSAPGFIADLFLEFSYFGLIGCFLLGWIYSFLWRKAVLQRGIWALLYLYAAILSIYVPTQSISAPAHRFLLMAVPALLLWRWFVTPVMMARPQVAVAPRQPAFVARRNPRVRSLHRAVGATAIASEEPT